MRIRKHAARLLSAARNFHTTAPASSAPAATIPTVTTVVDINGSSSSFSSALDSQALGSLSSSSVNVLPDLNQTVVVCQSNQSPWDVLPPSYPEDYLIQLDHHHHIQEEKTEDDDDHGINGGDWSSSCAVVNRTRSTQLKFEVKPEKIDAIMEEKPVKMVQSKKKKKKIDAVVPAILDDQRNYCKKSDGKGWQCKKEAEHPYTLCDYHLSQIRGYYHGSAAHHPPTTPKTIKNSAPTATKKKKKKSKAAKKVKKDDGPEFYYYFGGFGPWRGKRRGDGVGRERKDGETTTVTVTTSTSTTMNNVGSSSVCGGVRGASCDNVATGIDPESLDNVEESSSDDVGPGRKKKWRKPIKARSLKSLF